MTGPAVSHRYWTHQPTTFHLPDGTGRTITIAAGHVMAFHPDYADPDRTTLVLRGGITFTVAEPEAAVEAALIIGVTEMDEFPDIVAALSDADVPAAVAEQAPGVPTPEAVLTPVVAEAGDVPG